MTTWLNEITLTGNTVSLLPMRKEHVPALIEAATDGELWKLWYTFIPDAESTEKYVNEALSAQRDGTALPFVVFHHESQRIIGTTRFCHADNQQQRVEVGYTWYAKSFQKTAVNTVTVHQPRLD